MTSSPAFNPSRLAKVLALLSSPHAGEALAAARRAQAILDGAGLTWGDLTVTVRGASASAFNASRTAPKPRRPKPAPAQPKATAAEPPGHPLDVEAFQCAAEMLTMPGLSRTRRTFLEDMMTHWNTHHTFTDGQRQAIGKTWGWTRKECAA